MVYVLFYIHTDAPDLSEILGVYEQKYVAVSKLIDIANYREKNGILTQYGMPTDDYPSMDVLRSRVEQYMMLDDVDIYRISKIDVQ